MMEMSNKQKLTLEQKRRPKKKMLVSSKFQASLVFLLIKKIKGKKKKTSRPIECGSLHWSSSASLRVDRCRSCYWALRFTFPFLTCRLLEVRFLFWNEGSWQFCPQEGPNPRNIEGSRLGYQFIRDMRAHNQTK